MAFGTKKSVVATPSFSERMASIKSMFKTAHENASNLHAEMESEIAKKESQIAALQEDIKTIGVTKQEAGNIIVPDKCPIFGYSFRVPQRS